MKGPSNTRSLKGKIQAYLVDQLNAKLAYPFEPQAIPTYIFILTQLLCVVATFYWFGFTTDLPIFTAAITWMFVALAGIMLRRIHFPRFGAAMEASALLYGQGVVSIPLVITIGAFNAPWADSLINSWDLLLGFSWREAIDILQPFQSVWQFSYNTFIWQGWIVISILAFQNRLERLWVMVAASTLALIVVSATFVWMPARAAYAFYGFAPGEGPEAALSFLTPLTYIREGGRHITFSTISGMVSFPSYHAASGVIFTWSCWQTRLRVPFLLLNVGLLIGTISVGGHYLSDVLAGVLLAGGSIMLSTHLVRYSARSGRVPSSAANPSPD